MAIRLQLLFHAIFGAYGLTMKTFDQTSSAKHMRRSTRIHSLLQEDGIVLCAIRLTVSVVRYCRGRVLGPRLRQGYASLGSAPKLRGLRHIKIGTSFAAGDSLWLEAITSYASKSYNPLIVIGERVGAGNHVHIGATFRIEIGNDVLLGSRITIIDHNHGSYEGSEQSSPLEIPLQRRLSCSRSIVIGDRVWLGDGVVVLPGASIGAGSIIGANSVVCGSIPGNCIAVGVPARPVRRYSVEAHKWIPLE